MIRLFAFISIISLFNNGRNSLGLPGRGDNDSLNNPYRQFLLKVNDVSGEPVEITGVDADVFILMDYGHCSKCAKEVLNFMGDACDSGLKVIMIHYGDAEAYASNRTTRNKYRFEYAYLREVYFSPMPLPDKSQVPVLVLSKSNEFIVYGDFQKEKEMLLRQVKKAGAD